MLITYIKNKATRSNRCQVKNLVENIDWFIFRDVCRDFVCSAWAQS